MNVKTEGGHKRGHSQMEHYAPTEEVKRTTRKARRRADKAAAKDREDT